MVNVVLEEHKKGEDKVEFVERKGIGHPDTIIDNLCEASSKALTKYYKQHFRKTLHHNIDKGLIIAGKSTPNFKSGEITKVTKIIIAGRAVTRYGNIKVPINKIIQEAVKEEMQQFNLPYELELHISDSTIQLNSTQDNNVANDTSLGVGHYPLTKLEKTVLQVSQLLENESYKRKFPAIGYDTKVLGMRSGSKLHLTLAIAFMSRYVKDINTYKQIKKDIKKDLELRFGIKVDINSLDTYQDVRNIYLTVTGLSAENGDDGSPGRGNRYNELITPNQSMSLESFAGKNLNHPGKTYQALAHHMAKEIAETLKAKHCSVKIASQIGKPLTEPLLVSVKLDGKINMASIKDIVDSQCKNIPSLQKSLLG